MTIGSCTNVRVASLLAILLAVGCAGGSDDDTAGGGGNVTVLPADSTGATTTGGTGTGSNATTGTGGSGLVTGGTGAGNMTTGGNTTAGAGTGTAAGGTGTGTATDPNGGMGMQGTPDDGAGAGVAGMGGSTMDTDPGTDMTGGTPVMGGSADPVVPALTADCPEFRRGTITFMGLGGITMEAGSKASSPSAPMLFYWHGTGSFAGEYSGSAGSVVRGVTGEGGILISFQGSTGGDLLSGTSVFGRGDFELTDQFVACGVQNHNVDARRIFTTGCSAGGLFAGAMAAMRSNYVAAAAPNSGGWTVPVQFQGAYTPALMTIHGAPGRDVVIIDFSNSSATADNAFKQRGGFVINCNHGGGHCGGGPLSDSIWEFFKAHPYGVDPHPWTSLPAGFHNSCEIF